MPPTAMRLEVFTESVLRGTTRLTNQRGGIDLAQGLPDFDPLTRNHAFVIADEAGEHIAYIPRQYIYTAAFPGGETGPSL